MREVRLNTARSIESSTKLENGSSFANAGDDTLR